MAPAPALSKLGGTDWERTKRRVRRAVAELAEELLEIYAARESAPGFSFSPDTVWQRELEEAFPYTETPDQERTIEEVKGDMLRRRPMDRLVCGDVGYGKTEVALRAAFKAVQDGKQVAVLVPTTVLAQQHLGTFERRLGSFPVEVAMLSRFVPKRQQEKIVAGVADGTVDMLIGTHRILSQGHCLRRPGAAGRRRGAALRGGAQGAHQVDPQGGRRADPVGHADSAHPAPQPGRASATCPSSRRRRRRGCRSRPASPRTTTGWCGTPSTASWTAAARSSSSTTGWRPSRRAAERVRRLVPRAKIAIGHGQMAEGMLERVMLDFDAGRFDVLVCTTIIESGLDIPNANTIIISRADTFGLAQLYQLRGRVGRSDRRAYAYLLHRRGTPLSAVARKRLHAIFSASDLGAGYQIALSDLEIRGAGNILGAEQHGFMAAVGFELYTRMLAEAVDVRRGRVVGVEPAPVRMDLPGSAYLPDAYVGDAGAKLEMYRRFAAIRSDGDAEQLRARPARPIRTDPAAGRGPLPGGRGAHGGGGGRRAGGARRASGW